MWWCPILSHTIEVPAYPSVLAPLSMPVLANLVWHSGGGVVLSLDNQPLIECRRPKWQRQQRTRSNTISLFLSSSRTPRRSSDQREQKRSTESEWDRPRLGSRRPHRWRVRGSSRAPSSASRLRSAATTRAVTVFRCAVMRCPVHGPRAGSEPESEPEPESESVRIQASFNHMNQSRPCRLRHPTKPSLTRQIRTCALRDRPPTSRLGPGRRRCGR
jgi:hypothetical protein